MEGMLNSGSLMKTLLVAVAVLLGTMYLCFQAQANDLQTAVTSFPQLRPEAYNPKVAARCANVLIQAGEERACAALLEAAKAKRGDTRGAGTVNLQVCHLCRLLFTSTNPSQPLRRPALGAIQGFPAESIIRDPPEWPDLPFVVVEGIPLSLCQGYALGGEGERAEGYLDYCRANGRFRTNFFAVPTTITASNALVSVFASPAWNGLSRKDAAWSYDGNENEAKKRLWAQITNVANQQGGANGEEPVNSQTSRTSAPAAPRRSP
jgi:hypothetical protein